MTVRFDCEGCGDAVIALGLAAPPANGFCGICDQLNACLGLDVVTKPGITLDEFWKIYKQLHKNDDPPRPHD
jgi:hypothetical protein